ncbi:MAG: hypothetical protein ACK50P_05855 [Planctomycetaceae bacterium]
MNRQIHRVGIDQEQLPGEVAGTVSGGEWGGTYLKPRMGVKTELVVRRLGVSMPESEFL